MINTTKEDIYIRNSGEILQRIVDEIDEEDTYNSFLSEYDLIVDVESEYE